MQFTDFKDKYGDRVVSLAVSEIVREGLEAVAAKGDSGRPMEITIAAVASDLMKQDWNDVRAVIKRSL